MSRGSLRSTPGCGDIVPTALSSRNSFGELGDDLSARPRWFGHTYYLCGLGLVMLAQRAAERRCTFSQGWSEAEPLVGKGVKNSEPCRGLCSRIAFQCGGEHRPWQGSNRFSRLCPGVP